MLSFDTKHDQYLFITSFFPFILNLVQSLTPPIYCYRLGLKFDIIYASTKNTTLKCKGFKL